MTGPYGGLVPFVSILRADGTLELPAAQPVVFEVPGGWDVDWPPGTDPTLRNGDSLQISWGRPAVV